MPEVLPTYLGNCEIEETDRSEARVDAYGLDQFVVFYQGAKVQSKVDAFSALLKASQTNSGVARSRNWRASTTDIPGMSIKDWTLTTDRSWAYFATTYTGKRNNQEPEVNISGGLRDNTISLYVGEIQSPVAAEIDYRAPYTHFRYATKTKPTGPRFKGRVDGSAIQIIDKRGVATLAAFLAQPKVYASVFDFQQDGLWWLVDEENELRLTQNLEVTAISL